MTKAIKLLKDVMPNWANVIVDEEGKTLIEAIPELPDGSNDKPYFLVIDENEKGCISVKEHMAGDRLPRHCPERHIEPSGNFCLGLGLGWSVDSKEAASQWWITLHKYLSHQHLADKLGYWRQENNLSHGKGGLYHVEMRTFRIKLLR